MSSSEVMGLTALPRPEFCISANAGLPAAVIPAAMATASPSLVADT